MNHAWIYLHDILLIYTHILSSLKPGDGDEDGDTEIEIETVPEDKQCIETITEQ